MIFAGDLIEECQLLLGDPAGEYHTEARMILHLNRALRNLSTRSQSIDSWIFRGLAQDEFRYGLPHDFLRAKIVSFSSDSRGWYRLTSRNDHTVDSLALSRLAETSPEPVHYSIHGRSAIERVVGTVDSVNADNYSFVSILIDDRTPGGNAFVDDRVFNITSGGEGFIEAIDGDRVFHSPLYGGTSAAFADGDSFRIASNQAPLQTLNIAPVPSVTSDEGVEPLGVYYSRYHYKVNKSLIDLGNDVLEVDPELEPTLIQLVCYWAAVAEHEAASPQAQTFMANYNSEYFRAIPKVRKRMRDNINGWVRWASRVPRKANLTGAPDIGGHPFTNGVIN